MNRIFLFTAVTACALLACNSNANHNAGTDDIEKNTNTPENPNATNKGPKGTPTFVSTMHDFGNITDGEIVQHTFKLKNTGKGDLTISNVQASCGCTTPDWTREVIPPGGEGHVQATFDSKGKGGPDAPRVQKSITVMFANSTVDQVELKFVSNILDKSAKDNK
jgi:hypothetical protein